MQVPEYPEETILTFTTVPLKLGFGAADEAGYEAKRLEAKRALICTDKNLRAIGHPDRIREIIEKEGIGAEIYDDIHVEPTDKSIDKVAKDLRGNDFDLYVAVGGGSTIDTTKAISLLITYPAPVMEYVNKPIGHAKPVPGPLKPLLVLPTTSGTGSETTSVSVLDILDMKVKTGIAHPFLRPTMALLDPLLTESMSPQITASTGMDVLTHALESYTSLPFDKRKKPDHPSKRAAYIGSNILSDIFSATDSALLLEFTNTKDWPPSVAHSLTNFLIVSILLPTITSSFRSTGRHSDSTSLASSQSASSFAFPTVAERPITWREGSCFNSLAAITS